MLLLLWLRHALSERMILPPHSAVVLQMELDVDKFLLSKEAQRKEADKELQAFLALVPI
jgi:hypothetical protein